MRIQAEVRTPAKLVFNHDVAAVVGVGWNDICINDSAGRDGVNNIQRFSVRVALEGTNVHPFVKPGLENGRAESSRISDEPVLSALPWRAGDSLEITFHVLIESGIIASQQPVILGGQNDVDRLAEGGKPDLDKGRDHRSNNACEADPTDAIAHKRFCWLRLGFATQGVIR